MYTLNEKICNLTPYEPMGGSYKIRLDANESYLRLPEYVADQISAKLLQVHCNRYPDPKAASLCKAFAKYYGIDSQHVMAGNGSDELISLLFTGFLMKGERYAVLEPDFSMYAFYGALSEVQRVTIAKAADFSVDWAHVVKTCKEEKVRLLVFSNPCNPTSLGADARQMRRVVEALPDTLVVVDEAYMDFWDESLIGQAHEYDNLLVLRTCSKAFGLAAVRVGFAVGNQTLVRALQAIKSPYNVNTLSQIVAECVLLHRGENGAAISQIVSAKEELYSWLKELEVAFPQVLEVLPSCTNFIVVRSPVSEEIWRYFLDIGIAVRNFPGFLRITAGSYNENLQLVKFLKKYLEEGNV